MIEDQGPNFLARLAAIEDRLGVLEAAQRSKADIARANGQQHLQAKTLHILGVVARICYGSEGPQAMARRVVDDASQMAIPLRATRETIAARLTEAFSLRTKV